MVSMYGGRPHGDAPDPPHLKAERISGKVYLSVTENDAYTTMEMNKNMQTHFDDVGVHYKLDIDSDTEHGFCFPKRCCYAPEADAKHWHIMTALFARRFGKTKVIFPARRTGISRYLTCRTAGRTGHDR